MPLRFAVPLALLVLLLAALAAFPAPARTSAAGMDSARCLAAARATPEEGFEAAARWRAAGGGDAARHCAAVALLHRGETVLAAEEFEALARASRGAAAARADLFAAAARARLAAGEADAACDAATAALALAPVAVDRWLDRAEIRAASGRFWETLDDLHRALELDPGRVDALVFRAATWRALDARELAADDLARALEAAPDFAEAWLERGTLRLRGGDAAGARRDWLKAVMLDPDGPAGDAGRASLRGLDRHPGLAATVPPRRPPVPVASPPSAPVQVAATPESPVAPRPARAKSAAAKATAEKPMVAQSESAASPAPAPYVHAANAPPPRIYRGTPPGGGTAGAAPGRETMPAALEPMPVVARMPVNAGPLAMMPGSRAAKSAR